MVFLVERPNFSNSASKSKGCAAAAGKGGCSACGGCSGTPPDATGAAVAGFGAWGWASAPFAPSWGTTGSLLIFNTSPGKIRFGFPERYPVICAVERSEERRVGKEC